MVLRVNGVRVGVIGAGLEVTPELVSAGATAGLTFLPAAQRIRAESGRLRRQGVKVQVVLIHEGSANGANAVDGSVRAVGRADRDDRAGAAGYHRRRDVAGHTHRVSNMMVGDILVTEGINAGATYSVLQLMVATATWSGPAARPGWPAISAYPARRRPGDRR